jgi:hypothetical protein
MKWLGEIVRGLASALLEWWQGQADKPNTTKDANTPKAVRDDLAGDRDEWMRRKDADARNRQSH